MQLRSLLAGLAATTAIAVIPVAAASAQSGASSTGSAPAKPAAAAAAPSKSIKGTWVGFANTQNGNQPVTIVFDSTADGWVGATVAPQMQSDSLYLEGVKMKGDTVTFSLNIQGTGVGFFLNHNGNRMNGDVWVNGQSAGTMRLARAGSAEAAELMTPPSLLDDRRRH